MTEHEGAQIESILINKTKVGQASRQVWSGDVNLPDESSLELAQHVLPTRAAMMISNTMRGATFDMFSRPMR